MAKFNFKEFSIAHGEKVLFGATGCFVLAALLGMTKWGTYQKTPEEFAQKVNTGKANFSASIWTDEEKKTFLATNPGDTVASIIGGIPDSHLYLPGTRMFPPIYKARERRKEPKLFVVQKLYADAGRILLELYPEKTDEAEIGVKVDSDPSADPATGDGPKVDGPRIDGPRIDGPRPAGGGGAGVATPGGAETVLTPEVAPTPSLDQYAGTAPPGMDGGYGATGMAGGGVQRNVEPKGTWFASIRGVIPMKQQVDEFAKSLARESSLEAAREVQYFNFELERQTAVAGDNPWSGAWEMVDIDVALKLLGRVDFDSDIVGEQYRDAVFTMPLPYRVSGTWDAAYPEEAQNSQRLLASHPQIRQLLTEKQKELEEIKAKALIDSAQKTQKARATGKQGFNLIQHDTRSLQNQMNSSADMQSQYQMSFVEQMQAPGMDSYQTSNPSYGGGGPGGYTPPGMPSSGSSAMSAGYGGMPQSGAFGSLQAVVTSELLLFRFFDFSVIPGNAYRYRVRLVLANPNYNLDPSELEVPESRDGQFRTTDWSELSSVAYIPDETQFFLSRVDDRRGVSVDVIQWMSSTGSFVKGPLEALTRGERVARWKKETTKKTGEVEVSGGVETEVLRPSEQTFDTERIDYVTSNTVIDYQRNVPISPEDFPDLGLGNRRLSVMHQAMVMTNQFGELVEVDSVSQESKYKSAKDLLDKQSKVWEPLKQRQAAPSGFQDLLAQGAGADQYAPPGVEGSGTKPPKGRKKSALKRGNDPYGDMMGSGYPGSGGGYPGSGGGYPGSGSGGSMRSGYPGSGGPQGRGGRPGAAGRGMVPGMP